MSDPLLELLERHLGYFQFRRVSRLLEPFYSYTEKKEYLLASSFDELKVDDVKHALKKAFRQKVSNVDFIGPFNCFPGPELMRSSLALEIRRNFRLIWNSRFLSAKDIDGSSLFGNLSCNLTQCLNPRELFSVSSHGKNLKEFDRLFVGENLWMTLFYFLGLHLAGEKRAAHRLDPLIQILPKCIPLGKKYGGYWVALIA